MRQRTKAVLGMYPTRDGVQLAVEAFRDAGFKNSEISVVLPDSMPPGELAGRSNKIGIGTGAVACSDAEVSTLGGAEAVPTGRRPAVSEEDEALLIVGPLAQALRGAGGECASEELVAALNTLGIPECETVGYADKVLQGRALLSVHCENAEMAITARRLHGDLGGMDVCTSRPTEPIVEQLSRLMAWATGR